MRRKDREITDTADILDILRRCETVRIGMLSESEPYVVPVSFAFESVGDRIILYFHCARIGRKIDALAQNPRVCIEADIFHKIEPTPHGITTRYESIIGFGCAEQVGGDAALHALRCLVTRYGYADYPVDQCHGLAHTAVYKITLDTLTGKRNLA